MMIKVIRFVAIVGVVLLLSGCTTTETVVGQPSLTRNYKLTVVESSRNRTLTPQETEQLRTHALQYLLSQGPVRNDSYFVRVDFPAETPGEPPEYMVVQLTAEAPVSYTVLNEYSDPWYYDPYDVRYSYVGLFGLGYAYYDQFYYDHNRYYRPIPPPVHYTRPHPPGNGHPTTGRPHPSNPTTPDAPRHRPKDPDQYAGDRNHPTSAKPNVARPPTGAERTNRPPPLDPTRYAGESHYPNSTKPNGVRPPAGVDRTNRPPPTGVTQRQDPGSRSGGHAAPGSTAPVAQTEHNRSGGGRSSPPPAYAPPPPRDTTPASQSSANNNAAGDKRNQIATEQEK